MPTILEHPNRQTPQEEAETHTNIAIEQALLGAMLSSPDAVHYAGMELQPKHFYVGIHQRIFEKIREGAAANKVVNPVSLAHFFKDGEQKPENSYLARLIAVSAHRHELQEYATTLRSLAMVRLLQAAAREVLAAPAGVAPDDLVGLVADAVVAAQRGSVSRQAKSAGAVTEIILSDVRAKMHPTSTGIPRLDRMMKGGLYPSKMYGIGARKKTGKTGLLTTISYNLNHSTAPLQEGQSGKHLFICGEMGAKEIHQRALARKLDVEPDVFLNDEKRPHDFEQQLAYEATHGPRNTLYMDAPGLTLAQLKQMVAIGVAKHRIDGFILDYWQLVGGGKPNAKTEHLDEVAQWIATACKQYNIWAVVTAQINREGNYRGGDGLQNASDMVLTLERDMENANQRDYAWLTIQDSRYTAYGSLGTKANPGLYLNPRGPFFEEAPDTRYSATDAPETTPIEAYAADQYQ